MRRPSHPRKANPVTRSIRVTPVHTAAGHTLGRCWTSAHNTAAIGLATVVAWFSIKGHDRATPRRTHGDHWHGKSLWKPPKLVDGRLAGRSMAGHITRFGVACSLPWFAGPRRHQCRWRVLPAHGGSCRGSAVRLWLGSKTQGRDPSGSYRGGCPQTVADLDRRLGQIDRRDRGKRRTVARPNTAPVGHGRPAAGPVRGSPVSETRAAGTSLAAPQGRGAPPWPPKARSAARAVFASRKRPQAAGCWLLASCRPAPLLGAVRLICP